MVKLAPEGGTRKVGQHTPAFGKIHPKAFASDRDIIGYCPTHWHTSGTSYSSKPTTRCWLRRPGHYYLGPRFPHWPQLRCTASTCGRVDARLYAEAVWPRVLSTLSGGMLQGLSQNRRQSTLRTDRGQCGCAPYRYTNPFLREALTIEGHKWSESRVPREKRRSWPRAIQRAVTSL